MSNKKSKTKIYDDRTFFGSYLDATDEKKYTADEIAAAFSHLQLESILDLGCFDGTLTMAVVAKILNSGRSLKKVIGVEPSSIPLGEFQKKVDFGKIPVSFELINKTMEDFLDEHRKPFDWVTACHSLYWLQNPKETISKIVKSAKSGAIVIRDNGIFHQIEVKYRPLMIKNHKKFFCSDEIIACLRDLNIPFKQKVFQAEMKVPPLSDLNAFKTLVGFLLDLTIEQVQEDRLELLYRDLCVNDGHIHFNNSFITFGHIV